MGDAEEDQVGPRWTQKLSGHARQQAAFLTAAEKDSLHHAWLLTGAKGIGKATFAWLATKHLLKSGAAQAASSLFGEGIGPTHLIADSTDPLVHRIALGGHADVRSLEKTAHPKTGKLRSEIVVEQIQDLASLFTLSASEGGWRIVIIDSVDDLNRNAANALLKILEEPPKDCVFFLVSHQPGRLLPTIRSRCRQLHFRNLHSDELKEALVAQGLPEPDKLTLDMAEGSPGAALMLMDHNVGDVMADMVQIASASGAVHPDLLKAYQSNEALSALGLSCLQILFANLAGASRLLSLEQQTSIVRDLYPAEGLPALVSDIEAMAQKQQRLRMDRGFFWIALTETLRDRRAVR